MHKEDGDYLTYEDGANIKPKAKHIRVITKGNKGRESEVNQDETGEQ